ncbi:MAG: alpha/beta hydrolase [Planctomycetaceae bacterium]|nr:alpha/beta hydrolase [Planctomycetaceae bacterium]
MSRNHTTIERERLLAMLTNSPQSPSAESSEPQRTPLPVAENASSEGCPTPLDWRQVVAAYRREGESVTVQTNNGPVDTYRFGDGPPLYLLNGFVGSHELFALLAWLLKDEHATIAIDWHAETPDKRLSPLEHLHNLSTQVIAVADELGHAEWAMHATSFGCLVAMQAMLDVPDRISRCSLQGAFARRHFSLTERALMLLGRHAQQSLADVSPALRVQQENHRQWFPPFDGTRWSFYEEQMGRTPLRELASRATLSGRVDLTGRLSEIQTPLLVIACEGDGRRSVDAQLDIAERTPHSRVESLDNCGSLPHVTHPHRLAKLLRQFRDESDCQHQLPSD